VGEKISRSIDAASEGARGAKPPRPFPIMSEFAVLTERCNPGSFCSMPCKALVLVGPFSHSSRDLLRMATTTEQFC
jgi:hypothetical protein